MTLGLHLPSLEFAEREVAIARLRAHRALRHLDAVGELPIPELRNFAHHSTELAIRTYRSAIGKRAFELRQLI